MAGGRGNVGGGGRLRQLKAHGGGTTDPLAGTVDLGVESAPLTLHTVDNILLAAVNVLVWCRVLQYYSSNKSIGVLIIMIIEMMQDMAIWILLSVRAQQYSKWY